jgi:glycosyltransferase involved in cell wall biosynthesis
MTAPQIPQLPKVAFIQPYGLGESNGGAKILRSLVQDAPVDVISCNTSPWPSLPPSSISEIHLSTRPFFGRLESTRFAWIPSLFDSVWLRKWTVRLKNWLVQEGVSHLHIVPHSGVDYRAATLCARKLGLPLNMSVHDHPRYCFKGQVGIKSKLRAFGEAWRDSASRFVISEPMGLALCHEFGERSWQIVTDGVNAEPLAPRVTQSEVLNIYFMGLFHQSYQDNLRALLAARTMLHAQGGKKRLRIRLRCGSIPAGLATEQDEVEILPFSTQDQVLRDMEEADLLYLPLPFGEEHADFVRYSLSTKMVTYLGSGRPILLHAPTGSAAADLLLRARAATHLPSNSPEELAGLLGDILKTPELLQGSVSNALRLAQTQFDLQAIHSRFWKAVLSAQI